jgi:hypothetical protein
MFQSHEQRWQVIHLAEDDEMVLHQPAQVGLPHEVVVIGQCTLTLADLIGDVPASNVLLIEMEVPARGW